MGRKQSKERCVIRENSRRDKMKFLFAKNHFGNEVNKTLHFIIYIVYTWKVKFHRVNYAKKAKRKCVLICVKWRDQEGGGTLFFKIQIE